MTNNPKSVKESYYEKGIFVDQLASLDRIKQIIRKLRPVKTEIELVRIGADADGGYLVPNDLDGINMCFSPGVDRIASFEEGLLKFKIGSHLADFSVDSVPGDISVLSFTKKFLGCVNSEKFITLDSWVQEHCSVDDNSDLLLQMDIEGGEYETLLACSPETLNRFRIIVLEIHEVESWGQSAFLSIVAPFFDKILSYHHPVHVHPNNCCGIVDINGVLAPRVFELTLLRKDRATITGYVDSFPNPLDRANILLPDLVLPESWYKFDEN